jgi:hypothetical protein
MKRSATLTVASLLSIVLFLLHLADDIVRGMEPGTFQNLIAVPIAVVWLYGTLVLAERRSGYVIMLVASLLGSIVPIVHMMGKGVGVASNVGKSGGAFFFVWTLFAIGVTSLLSVVLSVRGLWSLRRRTAHARRPARDALSSRSEDLAARGRLNASFHRLRLGR